MLILNSKIYISLFLLIQVISFQEKPPWNVPAWTRTYIYECKTRGHGNTEQKREASNIVFLDKNYDWTRTQKHFSLL